jgi:hypothetical protein
LPAGDDGNADGDQLIRLVYAEISDGLTRTTAGVSRVIRAG